jgi:hypothetical protein
MQNDTGRWMEKLDLARFFVCEKPGFYMNVVGYKDRKKKPGAFKSKSFI